MIRENLVELVREALRALSIGETDVVFEHPSNARHGDYSTNIALVCAKSAGKSPRGLAEDLARELEKNKPEAIGKIEVAGPGFINFFLSKKFFVGRVREIVERGEDYGRNDLFKGKKVIIEYTDPNPFKEFHIGHLMSNTIGESISRLFEFSGAEVRRVNYQGDVGLHVAKALWGKLHNKHLPWGDAYAAGSKAYGKDDSTKADIIEINKAIYEIVLGSGNGDERLSRLYFSGRIETLKAFEKIYSRLGMKLIGGDGEAGAHFDKYFYESETGKIGKEIVQANIGKVFEESNGAIVFRGEKYGLHTRVFLTSNGLPTYEAKELGLAILKHKRMPHDLSIVITGNEIVGYFRVVLEAMRHIPDMETIAKKIAHVPHGMLRLPTGKMSSRTGDVISAEDLLDQVQEAVLQRMKTGEFDNVEREKVADLIAVGAVKYVILRQSAEKDIIFDFDKSLSFEGDSGPYLQYTYVRARSVLKKAKEEKGNAAFKFDPDTLDLAYGGEISGVERLLYQFPEVVKRASMEYSPHYITTYLTELASAFNTYYAMNKIVSDTAESPYRLALTQAVAIMLKSGLCLLGIDAPERM
jgi:arginyl-tRNA synthetase